MDNVMYIQPKSNFNPLENSSYAWFNGLISNFYKYVPLSFNINMRPSEFRLGFKFSETKKNIFHI